MKISEILQEIGLTDKESEVYLACLELGDSTVVELTYKSNIKRSTIYDALEGLIEKGLVFQGFKGKKRYYYAIEPEKIIVSLENKKNRLAEALPMLKFLQNSKAGIKPVMKYYEGINGLRQVYLDSLEYPGEKLAFITEDVMQYLGKNFLDDYIKQRKDKGLTARIIGPNTKEVTAYKKEDAANNRETRLVDRNNYPFDIEMNIYGDRISYLSFTEKIAVIIQSEAIARNMRYLFNLAWQQSESTHLPNV